MSFLDAALAARLRRLSRIPVRAVGILYHEGLSGIYARLRYPKPFWRRRQPMIPLSGPVLIEGGTPRCQAQIAKALRDVELSVTFHADDLYACRILIDPALSQGRSVTTQDLLVLVSDEPQNAVALGPSARKARALLATRTETLLQLQQSGVPQQKLFAVKDADSLHEGMIRYLVAAGNSAPDHVDWRAFSELRAPLPHRLGLSLPETVARRHSFLSTAPDGFGVFGGLRYQPGWVGAAASFRLMASAYLDQEHSPVLLCEDDIEFSPRFTSRLRIIEDYLSRCDWDVFSGLLTNVTEGYRITRVTRHDGEVFVHLNRCVGMVCNVYNHGGLTRLASWRVETGMTIDRYLEQTPGLKVVTTVPFLANHRDNLSSSVWGFDNRRYRSMIQASEKRLMQMVEKHDASRRDSHDQPR